jgi:SAM-dependent methyltransferase
MSVSASRLLVDRFLDRGPLELETGKRGRRRWEEYLPQPAIWDVATVSTKALLDRMHDRFANPADDPQEVMSKLQLGLWEIKSATPEDVWQNIVQLCRKHPIRAQVHEDPFTSRSFERPRGYPGDAVLIDYLYSEDCHVDGTLYVSRLGDKIYRFLHDTPTGTAVRARRDIAATYIDATCERKINPRILSVACGHLREALRSRSVAAGKVERFVALDQDELSLQVVCNETHDMGVVPFCNSIKALFRGPLTAERFDLVYSTGLYDYLDDRLATKLTHRMFDLLEPGGTLLIANFLPDIWIDGYMETFMDWKPEQFQALTAAIPASQMRSVRTFIEPNENIVFLEVTRQE